MREALEVVVEDPWLVALVDPATRVEWLGDGAIWSESPLWLPEDEAVIWSDIPGNRVLRWTEATGEVAVERVGAARLNSPNVVVASDDSIWFTDPPYGITLSHEEHFDEREYGAQRTGNDTLFIAASTSLYLLRTMTRGAVG